jgi:large subunit ribosomal protein L24
MRKIGEIASGVLEAGTLAVPSAEGLVTASHGQVRLIHLATRAEGADLTVAGSVDLMEQNISARLSLSGGKDVAQSHAERPVVSIFLNGPLNNPKRTVDVSALTTWLTLRGVEQQSKQLEAMEAKRRLPMAGRPVDEVRPTSTVPPATQMQAPSLPPAIEIPTLPRVMEQKPARAPARTQSGTAAQPRPVLPRPLPLLPGAN